MLALNSDVQRETLQNEFDAFERACRIPMFRDMQTFACEEIILPPGGPYAGQLYTVERQPWSRLWFALIALGLWCRYAVVGPTQTGKTLTCYVIPAVYYLFERGENVGCGIPQMDMAWDKWTRDFLPVIMASRYRDQIPDSGLGSKGGKFESITFRNGATLKFLSAKGGDEKRSGVTIRILVMTEVDKFDEASSGSKEADPVTQMLARLDAFPTMSTLAFMECTVSQPKGRIWKEYSAGTASKIALKCPHCSARVTPEREHLVGYQDADNEIDAREMTHFICPACSEPWTEADRTLANEHAILIHRGQEVTPDGQVTGDPPKTLTAGFRWTAANNLLRPAADFGGKEWKAIHDPDDENTEKSLMQFTWAMPWTGEMTGIGIDEEIVSERLTGIPRGEIPEDVESLVAQIDLHSRWHYWTIMATSPGRVRSIIDYGLYWNPDRKKFGLEPAIRIGLERLVEELEDRQYVTNEGRILTEGLDFGMIDGGYHQAIGLEFVTAHRGKWRLSKGQGRADDRDGQKYQQAKERTPDIRPGDHWCDRRQPPAEESNGRPWWMVFSDINHWMHQVHSGFMTETFMDDGQTRRPGSIGLFGNDPDVHLKNIDAEIPRSNYAQQTVGWVWQSLATKKRGTKLGWVSQWDQDHWLDTGYGCLVADSVLRTYHKRFRPKPTTPNVPSQEPKRFETPDGRPYLITER